MAFKLLTDNSGTGLTVASFTTKLTSTYRVYRFNWFGCNPDTDSSDWMFNASIDGGSNYNVAKTSTAWRTYHAENDSSAALGYGSAWDLPTGGSDAGTTNFQILTFDVGNDPDESSNGELYLFNPSSTTYVTQFYSTASFNYSGDEAGHFFVSGYLNTADNIDAIQFKMSAGDFDGSVKMYGLEQ